jgi:hypothetical protein
MCTPKCAYIDLDQKPFTAPQLLKNCAIYAELKFHNFRYFPFSANNGSYTGGYLPKMENTTLWVVGGKLLLGGFCRPNRRGGRHSLA